MKKIFALVLVLILAISVFAACGGNSNNKDKSGKDEKFEYGKDYIAQNLKGDYSITYKYSVAGQEDALVITHTRTSAGVYMSYGGMEMLYIKNGDKYDIYQGSSENGFVKVDFMDSVTQEEMESDALYSIAYSFLNIFIHQYTDNISGLKKDGSATVAGRDCEKYTFQYSGFGAAVKYTYYIDKVTGVCMKWDYDVAAAGQGGSMTFECIEFKTSGVTLPAYK